MAKERIPRNQVVYFGFWMISDSAIDPTLEEIDFGEDHLVIKVVGLGEEVVSEGKSRLELLRFWLSVEIEVTVKLRWGEAQPTEFAAPTYHWHPHVRRHGTARCRKVPQSATGSCQG